MSGNFAAYNKAWGTGAVARPIKVLIGGNIGTGKSTIANLIQQHVENISLVSSGIFRAILQVNTTFDQNPYLYFHSYQLDQVNPDPTHSQEHNALK